MIRFESCGEGITFVRMARTLLGRPRYWTGCYIVDGWLFDCGPPALARDLAAALEGRAIEGLVLTHHHEDHSGAAAALHAERGLVPRIHASGVPLVAAGFAIEPYRVYAWGRPHPVRCEPLAGEVRCREMRFEVLHTPGHSHDHVCLFEPERGLLFCGDLFLAERLRYLRSDEDLSKLIESLRHVARLPAKQVFCAHRGPVRDGVDALRRKADHLEGLRERIRTELQQGVGEREIARRVVGAEGLITFLSLGHFSARNFVRAVARDATR